MARIVMRSGRGDDVASTQWNELTREDLNARLPGAVVLLPTGATEQHGPHLATGHDSFTVARIAASAAERVTGDHEVIVAPTLMFGSSAHHLQFGGSLSLATETNRAVVRDLVSSMLSAGSRRVFLLNGHGGNHELNQLVARDLALEQPADAGVAIAAASYWEIAAASLAADARLAGFRMPGHAGQFETATMLAMDSARVREPRPARDDDPSRAMVIPGVRVEASGWWRTFDGYTDSPARATAETGEIIIEHVVRDVAAALTAFAAVDASPAAR
jgi:creatinine amidohydrolase